MIIVLQLQQFLLDWTHTKQWCFCSQWQGPWWRSWWWRCWRWAIGTWTFQRELVRSCHCFPALSSCSTLGFFEGRELDPAGHDRSWFELGTMCYLRVHRQRERSLFHVRWQFPRLRQFQKRWNKQVRLLFRFWVSSLQRRSWSLLPGPSSAATKWEWRYLWAHWWGRRRSAWRIWCRSWQRTSPVWFRWARRHCPPRCRCWRCVGLLGSTRHLSAALPGATTSRSPNFYRGSPFPREFARAARCMQRRWNTRTWNWGKISFRRVTCSAWQRHRPRARSPGGRTRSLRTTPRRRRSLWGWAADLRILGNVAEFGWRFWWLATIWLGAGRRFGPWMLGGRAFRWVRRAGRRSHGLLQGQALRGIGAS